ncbi:hypothetical protein KC799_22060 [candidate division KSB1 bacterium]|nr:hypothetical protein [candidate division KSB1 bacterium]
MSNGIKNQAIGDKTSPKITGQKLDSMAQWQMMGFYNILMEGEKILRRKTKKNPAWSLLHAGLFGLLTALADSLVIGRKNKS